MPQNHPEFELLYDVDARPRSLGHWLTYTAQWLATMIYAVVWGYAIVALGLGFQGAELAGYMGRVAFLIGLASVTQAALGHRFAMIHGPSIVSSLPILAAFHAGGREYAVQSFTAAAIAGLIMLALAFFGLLDRIRRIWTPLTLGVLILTLGITVSSVSLRSLTAHGFGWTFWIPVALAFGAIFASIRTRGIWATIPALLIITGGYVAFGVMGRLDWSLALQSPMVLLPQPFPWGFRWPAADLILVMLIVQLMSALSSYGNATGYAQLVGRPLTPTRLSRMFIVYGVVETTLTGIFGVPSFLAYGENMGLVLLTRVAARAFLVLAGVLFMLLACLGPFAGLISALPSPVAGAVLLGISSSLIGVGAQTWSRIPNFGRREVAIAGVSVFTALGLYQLPPDAWTGVPRLLHTIFSSPIVAAVLFSIILEQIVFPAPRPPQAEAEARPDPVSARE